MSLLEPPRRAGSLPWRLPLPLLVGLLALGWFAAPSFRTLDWLDEGQIVYPSWRVAEGARPYVDLPHMYMPSLFFLHAGLFRTFGTDLAVLRVGIVLVKAAIAVLVFTLARRVASTAAAGVVTVAFLAVWGAPLTAFNTPYANHYGTALCLAGLVLWGDGGRWRGWVLAGFGFGLAATFKQTQGLFALVGLALCTLFLWGPTAGAPSRGQCGSAAAGIARLAALAGVVVLAGAYLAPRLGTLTAWLLLAPIATSAVALGARDLAGWPPGGAAAAGLGRLAVAGAAFALPVLAYVAYFSLRGTLGAWVFGTAAGLPQVMRWFDPLPVPRTRAVLLGAAILSSVVAAGVRPRGRRAALLGTVAALVAVLLVAGGQGGLGRYLIQGGWRQDALALLPWLPLAAVGVGLAALRHRRSDARFALVVFIALATLLQLYPSADLAHALMTLPVFLPVLAGAAVTARDAGERRRRVVTLALWTVVLAGPFVWFRLTAPVSASAGFARARGISGVEPGFSQAAAMVRWLGAQEPPPRTLFVTADQQLLYFLAGIPSAVEGDEFVLYLVGLDLIAPADAHALVPESRLLATLAAARPLVIDHPSAGAKRLLATYPALADMLAMSYRPVATFGSYRVLAPIGPPPGSEEPRTIPRT